MALGNKGLVSKEIVTSLLSLIEDRNFTTHTYDEELANDVFDNIIKHYQTFGQLFVVLQPSDNKSKKSSI